MGLCLALFVVILCWEKLMAFSNFCHGWKFWWVVTNDWLLDCPPVPWLTVVHSSLASETHIEVILVSICVFRVKEFNKLTSLNILRCNILPSLQGKDMCYVSTFAAMTHHIPTWLQPPKISMMSKEEDFHSQVQNHLVHRC